MAQKIAIHAGKPEQSKSPGCMWEKKKRQTQLWTHVILAPPMDPRWDLETGESPEARGPARLLYSAMNKREPVLNKADSENRHPIFGLQFL